MPFRICPLRWCILAIMLLAILFLTVPAGAIDEAAEGVSLAHAATSSLSGQNPSRTKQFSTNSSDSEWAKTKALDELLAEYAKRQSIDPSVYLSFKTDNDSAASAAIFYNRRIQTVRANGTQYRVAIQSADGYCTDGIRGEQVVLFQPGGRILDRIQCWIPESLFFCGDLKTAIYEVPEPDGAMVVIRYAGHSMNLPNWGDIPAWFHDVHSILFRGRDYSFIADRGILNTGKLRAPDVWAQRGLCRVKISDGRFSVLFPKLERPEELLRSAVSLRIKFVGRDGGKAIVIIDDHEATKVLVSTILVRCGVKGGEGKDLSRNASMRQSLQPVAKIEASGSAAVEFVLPNGGTIIATIKGTKELGLEGWGWLGLSSSAFYDKLCAAVSKREGRRVDLLANGADW